MVDTLDNAVQNAQAKPPGARAVIGFSGSTLYYAEVVDADDGTHILRRLGACDFPFDAEQAVFANGDPESLSTLSEALYAVFEGSVADAVLVATSPMVSTTFFTPMPVGIAIEDRDAHLRQEASLLADVPPAQPVRIRVSAVGTEDFEGEPHEWVHVLHVDEAIHARISLLAQTLRVGRYDLIDTTRAALAATAGNRGATGVNVLVGCMVDHTEVVVAAPDRVLFTTHGSGNTGEDTAYFTHSALQRVNLDSADVSRLLVYGTHLSEERLEPLRQLLDVPSEIINPANAFDRTPAGLTAADLAAYVPVLGAALV